MRPVHQPAPLDRIIVGVIIGLAAFPVLWGFIWAVVQIGGGQ